MGQITSDCLQHVCYQLGLFACRHLLTVFLDLYESSVGVNILGGPCLVHVLPVFGGLHLGFHDAPPLFKVFPGFVAVQCGYWDHLQCVA